LHVPSSNGIGDDIETPPTTSSATSMHEKCFDYHINNLFFYIGFNRL
jgi:hypothetical protein